MEKRFWSKHQKLIVPKQFSYFIVPGVSYICSEINLLYDQNGSSVEWRNRCFKEIENNFEDYIYILNSFIQYIVDNYSGNINQKKLWWDNILSTKNWEKASLLI